MTSVVNAVMDVTHWSEGISEIMVELVSIERTETDSKLSDAFLSVPVIDSKHLFAFWTNSFQHFILEGGFKNKVFVESSRLFHFSVVDGKKTMQSFQYDGGSS